MFTVFILTYAFLALCIIYIGAIIWKHLVIPTYIALYIRIVGRRPLYFYKHLVKLSDRYDLLPSGLKNWNKFIEELYSQMEDIDDWYDQYQRRKLQQQLVLKSLEEQIRSEAINRRINEIRKRGY
jgi:hypothetical protein